MKNNKIWFRRKLYGWGWFPLTWQGWLVTFAWVVIFISIMSKMDHEGLKNIFFAIVFTAVLIFICYKKGEKPRWQWGKRIND